MNVAYTIGRILLPLVFIVSGAEKLMNVSAIAKILQDKQIPVPDEIVAYLGGIPKFEALGYLIGGIEAFAGAMILVGLKARWGAAVLLVFTACTIFFFHNFWDAQGEAFMASLRAALIQFAVMGGLLLVVACGSGPTAFDRRA